MIPTDFHIFQGGRYTTNQSLTILTEIWVICPDSGRKLYIFYMQIFYGIEMNIDKRQIWSNIDVVDIIKRISNLTIASLNPCVPL